MDKELQVQVGPKVKIHLDSLRATLKKYQIGKRQVMIAYMDSDFKKFTSIHEDHPDPKRPLKTNCPKQLLNHNVPTDDVENTNGTN